MTLNDIERITNTKDKVERSRAAFGSFTRENFSWRTIARKGGKL